MLEGINVLSLCDGHSSGNIALERAGIKVDNYFASEINPYPIKVAQHNYPNIIQLGDLTTLKTDNLPKIDLVLSGTPCFVAGTKVITKNGIKSIEDVIVGDEVLTHTNHFRKVLKVGGKQNADILSVFSQGFFETKTTEEHPYYVRQMSRKKGKRVFSEPIWKKAGDLTKGDFIGLPILNTSENPLSITEEEAFIIGRYIADGHTGRSYRISEGRPNDRQWSLILSVGSHKLGDFRENIKHNHFTCVSHSQSVFRCIFNNKRLVEIVEQHCGSGAINKHLSMMLLNLPIYLLKRVLDGYLSGDGSVKNGNYAACSISKGLVLTLNLAVAKAYKVGSNVNVYYPPPTKIIEGRLVNQNTLYSIKFSKEIKKQNNYTVIDDVIWYPFRKLTYNSLKETVYNLEVEIDNSYTANNAIVHNCQSISRLGNGTGFEGKSGLFWDFVRVWKEVNPKYFLLENVIPKKKEWKQQMDEAMGVEGVLINSDLFVQQNRPRIYWTNIPIAELPERPDWQGDFYQWRRTYFRKNQSGVCPCLTANMGTGGHNVPMHSEDLKDQLSVEYLEELQGYSRGYTNVVSKSRRLEMIGNGWTVDVIEHILKGMEL